MIKKNLQKLFNLLGYTVSRKTTIENLELELYYRLYHEESIQNKRFYNIGAGSFFHPFWTNLDLKSEWYADAQKNIEFVNFDLFSLQSFPIKTETAELVYSSHVVEHLTNKAVQNMFNEAYRILKPNGIFRFSAPDIDLYYEAYKRNDEHFFCWIDGYSKLINEYSLPQMFLYQFAAQTSKLHQTTDVQKISNDELEELFASMKYENALDHCTSKCRIDIQYDNLGNHMNWWNERKSTIMLRKAGFKKTFRSGYGQSFSPIFRNSTFFDTKHPKLSLYIEAIKEF